MMRKCCQGERVRRFRPQPIATVAQRMIAEQMRKMEKSGENGFAQERS